MATSDAPISVSRVALTVRDLDRVGDFYQRAMGLALMARDGETMTLGAGDTPLLELRRDPVARTSPHDAGLFHTAFLLPARADLGRWLHHVRDTGLRLDGASDHLVSEAMYLHDPEGNGIEIYVDRPRSAWTVEGGMVRMATIRADLAGLMAVDGRWTGAPEGTVVGHVHLQVGDVAEAERFYAGTLGLDVISKIPQASFFSSGGYHHHLAGNVWNSRGAGPRGDGLAGLAEIELSADAAEFARLGRTAFADPWGNRIRIAPRPDARAA